MENQDVYSLIERDDSGGLEKVEDLLKTVLFIRNEQQQTPFSVAIRGDKRKCVEKLIENGAASSVFVKGYSPGSLVCTLPMAYQPPSSVFTHPDRLINVGKEAISRIDDALSTHISEMVKVSKDREAREASQREVEREQRKRREAKAGGSSGGPAKAPKTSFNHFPPQLNPGDIVRRGKDWSWGDQDTTVGIAYSGLALRYSAGNPTVRVEWRTDIANSSSTFHTNSYQYSATKQDLYLVDPR